MREDHRYIFFRNLPEVIPVIVINNKHYICPFKAEDTLQFIHIQVSKKFQFSQHNPKHNIIQALKLRI